MEINKETSPDLLHGHIVVGLVRTPLTTGKFEVFRGILLRAPGPGDPTPNTATIWVGGSRVTADSAPSTGGIPLPPGASIMVPVESTSLLYAISTIAGQDLAWIAC